MSDTSTRKIVDTKLSDYNPSPNVRVITMDVDRSPAAMLNHRTAQTIDRSGGDPSGVLELLETILKERSWEKVCDADGRPFSSFLAFVEASRGGNGLGIEKDRLLKLIEVPHRYEKSGSWRARGPALRRAVRELLGVEDQAAVDAQLPDYKSYPMTIRDMAIIHWGEAGAWAHDCYARWHPLLPELPDELPILIGLTAYGRCRGVTRSGWEHGPRITLYSPTLKESYGKGRESGRNKVADTLLHEMIHAWLMVTGQYPDHDGPGWYEACNRLSLPVLGVQQNHPFDAEKITKRKSVRPTLPNPKYDPTRPVGPGNRETIKGEPKKERTPEYELHQKMQVWPHPWRPADWDRGAPISCPTY